MKPLLAILFAAFGVCAASTIFFQFRFGHLTGPNSESSRLGADSPAAQKCRRCAVLSAILAVIFLILSCVIGATLR